MNQTLTVTLVGMSIDVLGVLVRLFSIPETAAASTLFGLWPAKLAADSAYGSAEHPAWLVHERGILRGDAGPTRQLAG